jgi:hypothetical protein
MRIVQADGFEFCFTDALDAFVFDETDRSKPTFHGAPMKGVDIVAEFAEAYVYVEMKDYDDYSMYDVNIADLTDEEKRYRQDSFRWLKNYLKYKFRDSYLYRHAEGKVEKPIHYICPQQPDAKSIETGTSSWQSLQTLGAKPSGELPSR